MLSVSRRRTFQAPRETAFPKGWGLRRHEELVELRTVHAPRNRFPQGMGIETLAAVVLLEPRQPVRETAFPKGWGLRQFTPPTEQALWLPARNRFPQGMGIETLERGLARVLAPQPRETAFPKGWGLRPREAVGHAGGLPDRETAFPKGWGLRREDADDLHAEVEGNAKPLSPRDGD